MPNQTISQLASLVGSINTGDYLPIVDVSSGLVTKKVTAAQLLANTKLTATYVVATVSSGFLADYYTTGTNDNVQINAAITAINTLGGGKLVLKAGTYSISNSIVPCSNLTLEGEGTATIIKTANAASIHTISVSGVSNVYCRNFQMDGNKANNPSQTGHLIRIDTATNIHFEDLYIHDSGLHGIISNVAVTDLYVSDVRTENNGTSANGSGLYLNGSTNVVVNNLVSTGNQLDDFQWKTSDKITATNIVSYSNGRFGMFAVDGHADLSNFNLYSNGAIGLSIQNGALASTTTVNATNGEIFNNNQDGVRITDSNSCSLSNLKVYDNGQGGGTYAGIRITTDLNTVTCNRSKIIGCSFYDDQGSPTQTYGFWANGSGAIDFNYFSGNQIYGNGTAQVKLDTWGTNNIIRNNIGYITEASGTATINSGTTAVTVTHGLSITPTLKDISVVLGTNATNDPGSVWISTITSTQFTINCRNNPGASNLSLAWKAVVL